MQRSTLSQQIGIAVVLALAMGTSIETIQSTSPQRPVVFSCEADLTGDKRADVVVSLGVSRPTEVLALVATSGGYQAFVLWKDAEPIAVSCERGESVRETKAGQGTGRLVRTPGAFVRVKQPEGAAAAYVWNGRAFEEVWVSD